MKHLRIETNNEDSLEVTLQQDGIFVIQVDCPWSGDSETGFGRTESVQLSKEQATELRDFLNKMIIA